MNPVSLRRRLAVIVTAVALSIASLVAVAPPAFASLTCPSGGTQHIGSTSDPTLVILYENTVTSTGNSPTNNDWRIVCIHSHAGSSWSWVNLKTLAYPSGGDGVCDGQLATSYGTWNDCITGLKFSADCHWSFSLYADSSFGSLLYGWSSPHTVDDMPFGWDESASSFRLTYSSVCQSLAGT